MLESALHLLRWRRRREGGREAWMEARRATLGSHIPRPQSPTFLTGEFERDFDFLVCIFGGEDE